MLSRKEHIPCERADVRRLFRIRTGQIDWKTEESRVGGTQDTLRSARTGSCNRSGESECGIRSRIAAADRSEKGGTRSKKRQEKEQEQFLQSPYEVQIAVPMATSCIRGGASLPYILHSVFRLSRKKSSWGKVSEYCPDWGRPPSPRTWPEEPAASASVPAGTGDPAFLVILQRSLPSRFFVVRRNSAC